MKENFSKVIILVQAPADIPFALDLITKYNSFPIHVYVLNVENNYKLLKHLFGDDIHIEYIPYPFVGYTSLKKIKRTKIEFKQKWNEHFEPINYNNTCVFFFSRFEDPFTCYLINKVSSREVSEIQYINHYDTSIHTIRIQDFFRCVFFNIVLYYITRAIFKITDWGKFPELDVAHYKNIEEKKIKITDINLVRYSQINYKQPAALFLVNPNYNGGAYDYVDYILKIKGIAIALKEKGAFIYVKGHPRMGLPEELDGIYDERIEDYIISELIDYSKFKIIIGCESTAIAHAAIEKKGATVSILNMLNVIDEVKVYRKQDYLRTQSHNLILFVNTTDVILNLYNNIK